MGQTIDHAFGRRLRELARARGYLTDESAARGLDVRYRSYQRWAQGGMPRGHNLERLAEGLGVSIAELLGQPPQTQFERIEGELDRMQAGLDRVETNQRILQDLIEQLIASQLPANDDARAPTALRQANLRPSAKHRPRT